MTQDYMGEKAAKCMITGYAVMSKCNGLFGWARIVDAVNGRDQMRIRELRAESEKYNVPFYEGWGFVG
jgi:hypothetical protein